MSNDLIAIAELAFDVGLKAFKVYEDAKAGKVTPEEAKAALTTSSTHLSSVVASNNATVDVEIAKMPHKAP